MPNEAFRSPDEGAKFGSPPKASQARQRSNWITLDVQRALFPLLPVLWSQVPTNVLGGALRCCCRDPLTGFYRDGYCRTGSGDSALHTVCAQMTNEFLEFSYARGNDLVTPQPGFPGLKEGDRWCLSVIRWHEALEAGVAPPVDLNATHASTLEFVTLEELQAHAST